MVVFALIVGVLAVSTAAPLVHAASEAPPLTVAALRIAIAAIVLSLLSGRQLSAWVEIGRRARSLIVFAGLLLAVHFGTWITSLYLTSTVASVALVASQPVFAVILGRVFLGDVLRKREAAGIAIAAIGCIVLAGGDYGDSDALAGDLLALVGAGTAAAYFVVGRGLRGNLPLFPYLAAVNLVAGGMLLLVAIGVGSPIAGFERDVYFYIAMSAIVPSVIGHTLLNWSVRRTAAHVVGLAILGEPVGATLIQWMVHGEVPPAHSLIGGAVLLLAIAVGGTARMAPR